MRHYSKMSDDELGRAFDDVDGGRSIRALLDSMESDELAEVRAEVDRTARVVMAYVAVGAGDDSMSELEKLRRLRSRQRYLEAKLAAQKWTP